MNLIQFIRVKFLGWRTWRQRHGVALQLAFNRIDAWVARFRKRDAEVDRQLRMLEDRITRMQGTPNVHSRNVYEVIEDLKARMPKGSAVSDFRMNQEIGKLVARLVKLEEQFPPDKLAWQPIIVPSTSTGRAQSEFDYLGKYRPQG